MLPEPAGSEESEAGIVRLDLAPTAVVTVNRSAGPAKVVGNLRATRPSRDSEPRTQDDCVRSMVDAACSAWPCLGRGRGGRRRAQDDLRRTSAKGWITNNGQTLPKANVQADGLNPHGSGGYIVVHEKPHGDFVLDFDYKLSQGVQLGRLPPGRRPEGPGHDRHRDRHRRHDRHRDARPGGVLRPGRPRVNAQKPPGEWNHMTITAKGPQDRGRPQRRDGLDDRPRRVDRARQAARRLEAQVQQGRDQGPARPGYLGFQDHGQDCWYKNVKVTTP